MLYSRQLFRSAQHHPKIPPIWLLTHLREALCLKVMLISLFTLFLGHPVGRDSTKRTTSYDINILLQVPIRQREWRLETGDYITAWIKLNFSPKVSFIFYLHMKPELILDYLRCQWVAMSCCCCCWEDEFNNSCTLISADVLLCWRWPGTEQDQHHHNITFTTTTGFMPSNQMQ